MITYHLVINLSQAISQLSHSKFGTLYVLLYRSHMRLVECWIFTDFLPIQKATFRTSPCHFLVFENENWKKIRHKYQTINEYITEIKLTERRKSIPMSLIRNTDPLMLIFTRVGQSLFKLHKEIVVDIVNKSLETSH